MIGKCVFGAFPNKLAAAFWDRSVEDPFQIPDSARPPDGAFIPLGGPP